MLHLSAFRSGRNALLVICAIVLFLSIASWQPDTSSFHIRFDRSAQKVTAGERCSPQAWSNGGWVRKPDAKQMIEADDVYEISGFLGCGSNRDVLWHLGNGDPKQFGWRGNVSAYDWAPGAGCPKMPSSWREDLVVDLVENGGWLLIGDSLSQEHFFSISCLLYPHIKSTPDYSKKNWPKETPMHMYLHPNSDLIPRMRMPEGFDIAKTPLVSYRRNDLLFGLTEVETLHNGGSPPATTGTALYGKEPSWNMSPTEYLPLFLTPLPEGNYRALIVNTAGHWSLKLFAGLKAGFPEINDLFRVVASNWAYQVGRALDYDLIKTREVIVRPYLPGHDRCHSDEIMNGGPTDEEGGGTSFNWGWIPRLNAVFEDVVYLRGHPRIHYVGIDRPGRMRPDAHVLMDCLHVTVGTGVIEGWTQYIHHFLSDYLPWTRAADAEAV